MDASSHILHTEPHPAFLPPQSSMQLMRSSEMPPRHLVTSAHVLACDGPRVLLVHHRHRGWELPGGHLEPRESPEQALRREALEEGAAGLDNLRLLGFWHIQCHGDRPEGYNYPWPESYMLIYGADVSALHPFQAWFETDARELLLPDELMLRARGRGIAHTIALLDHSNPASE